MRTNTSEKKPESLRMKSLRRNKSVALRILSATLTLVMLLTLAPVFPLPLRAQSSSNLIDVGDMTLIQFGDGWFFDSQNDTFIVNQGSGADLIITGSTQSGIRQNSVYINTNASSRRIILKDLDMTRGTNNNSYRFKVGGYGEINLFLSGNVKMNFLTLESTAIYPGVKANISELTPGAGDTLSIASFIIQENATLEIKSGKIDVEDNFVTFDDWNDPVCVGKLSIGDIIISGGIVNANQGIVGTKGNITISGGTVVADGRGKLSSGIGACHDNMHTLVPNSVTIKGDADVTAYGDSYCAGIGGAGIGGAGIGGAEGSGVETIAIGENAVVKAYGTNGGAGIGGGLACDSGNISITGNASVLARAEAIPLSHNPLSYRFAGAGIGTGAAYNGKSGSLGNIEINTTGVVQAYGAIPDDGYRGADIGRGAEENANGQIALPSPPANFSVMLEKEAYTDAFGTQYITNAVLSWDPPAAPVRGLNITQYEARITTINNGTITGWMKAAPGARTYTFYDAPEGREVVFKVRALFNPDNSGLGMEATQTLKIDFTAPRISGPADMTVTAGYTATSTASYVITGTAPVIVTKVSGNSAIMWDDAGKRLYILSGLAPGVYPVVLKASNGIEPDASLTFTLTVNSQAPTVTGVAISPSSVSLSQGDLQSFSAVVTGANNPPQSVTWALENNTSARTTIDAAGLLTVGDDESGSLLIKAYSTLAGYAHVYGIAQVFLSHKQLISVRGVTVQDGEYDGQPRAYAGTPAYFDGSTNVTAQIEADIQISYSGATAAGATYGPTSLPPTNAGSYYLTFTVPASNATYAGLAVYPFTITKKTVTVAADEKFIMWGAPLPTPTFTVSGLIGPDTPSDIFATLPVARYNVADSFTEGVSVIEFDTPGSLTSAAGANYTLIHANGKLTVSTEVLPDFQLTALSPSYIYNAMDTREMRLTGGALDRTAYIEFTGASGTHRLSKAELSVAIQPYAANTAANMTLDLAKIPLYNGFKDIGNYRVRLISDTGYASAYRPFYVTNDSKYAPSVYGLLRIIQNSNGTFAAQMVSEGTPPPPGRVLLTIKGDITRVNWLKYEVKSGAIINRALTYKGVSAMTVDLTGPIDSFAKAVLTGSAASTLNWQDVAMAKNGFSITLDSSNTYKAKRADSGVDIGINILSAGGGFNYYVIEAAAGYGIKLYDTEFSLSGGVYIDGAVPGFVNASARLDLRDMLMRDKLGFPALDFAGKVSIAPSSILSGFIDGVDGSYFNFKMNTMPETFPHYIGMDGKLAIYKVIFMEGEFVFTWSTKDWIFIPETVDLFVRAESFGVPLVPPVIVAYINGFGGGITGLSSTVRGQYGQVPPISINAKGAFKDATEMIITIDKAQITIGPREVSVKAIEAKLLQMLSLRNVGVAIGFQDSVPSAGIPDYYTQFTGKIGIDYTFVWLYGGIDVKTVLRGYYVEKNVNNIVGLLSDLAKGKPTKDINNYANLAKDLFRTYDFYGKFKGEAGVDIDIAEGEASVEFGVAKEGLDVTLSGRMDAKAKAMFGLIPLGTISLGVKYNITRNDFNVWKISSLAAGLDNGTEPGKSGEPLNDGAKAEVSVTNIRPIVGLSLGQPRRGIMQLSVNPSSVTLRNDAPHGVSLTTDDPGASVKVTAPTGVADAFAAFPDGELLDTDGEARAFVETIDGIKVISFKDGTVFEESEEINSYYVRPVWKENADSGKYEGGFLISGAGAWGFDSESDVELTVLAIDPLPELTSVHATGADAAEWALSANGADVSDYYVRLLLCDDTDEAAVVTDLTPYDSDGYPLYPDADAAGMSFDIPDGIDSGVYKVAAQLYKRSGDPEKADECVSIAYSNSFNYINPDAPERVTGVSAVYGGNGNIDLSWDVVAGADGYIVEIMDTNGNPVPGMSEIDVTDGARVTIPGNKVITYACDADSGEIEEAPAGLDYGSAYQFSVRAYKEKSQTHPVLGDARIIQLGLPGVTSFTLPLPSIPRLSVNVSGSNVITEDGATIYAVNTLSPVVTVTSDVSASITITPVNGGAAASAVGQSATWNGNYAEAGMYSLRVVAVSEMGDCGETTVNILVNTGFPTLMFGEGSFSGAKGAIHIIGATDLGVDVTADATGVPLDKGEFTYTGVTNRLITPVTFVATNASGNSTERVVEVLMTDAGALKGLQPRLAGGGNVIGVGQSMDIELWGVFENGVEYILDESGAAISLTSGDSVSLNGWTVTGLSEGASVITVEYDLGNGATLKATLTLNGANQQLYTVTFDLNGGSRTGGGALTQTVLPGGSAVAPTVSRAGFIFTGWSAPFGYVTSDITVTALWTPQGGGSIRDEIEADKPKVANPPTGPSTPTLPAPPKPWQNPFADIRSGAWYYDDVAYVHQNGLMLGTSADPPRFSPDAPLTRGMLVTILHRHAGSPDASELRNPFSDVARDAWYIDAVKWAAANNIIAGYPGGLYGPDDPISRQDLAVILRRYARFAGLMFPAIREYGRFIDDADIADYAREAIEEFYRAGVIGGYPDGAVRPVGNATRAEVAAILRRLLARRIT